MPLIHNRYGKGRVRVMRLHREGERHEVRELALQVIVEGDFARAYTDADNATSVATDTIKNLVNVVALENLTLDDEPFCAAVADKLLSCYPQIEQVSVTGHQTKWTRLAFGGVPHPHGFVLDANGKPFCEVSATRSGTTFASGIDGYTFMKATQSGWENYVRDRYTTLLETSDRICATSMDARWEWNRAPANFTTSNEAILAAMLEVFATTYSASVQDSLYRMGEAALAIAPDVAKVSLACPNKHYVPVNLTPFGLDNANQVFLPTDEPHGQIECTVGR
jgi:urate oxidase